MRIVTGFGEAGFFVGAATMITDLAPVERRGEAVSYWSVAVYGGLSFGPALGEVLRGTAATTLTFVVSAALAFARRAHRALHRRGRRATPAERPKHLLHRAAIPPGIVLFLGLIPLAGFTAFVPLYADDSSTSRRA